MSFLVPYAGYDPREASHEGAELRSHYRQIRQEMLEKERERKRLAIASLAVIHNEASKARLTSRSVDNRPRPQGSAGHIPRRVGKLRLRRLVVLIARMFGLEAAEVMNLTRGCATSTKAHRMLLVVIRRRGVGLSSIGRMIGRDHTSVLSSLNKARGTWRAW